MQFPVHKSDTGSFQELAHASDVDFGQLSILTIKPGCERGDHYHERKQEWFCCISGECRMEITDAVFPCGEPDRTYTLSGDDKWFAEVQPMESHKLINTGKRECVVLIICDEEFDEGDPDTYRMEGEDNL